MCTWVAERAANEDAIEISVFMQHRVGVDSSQLAPAKTTASGKQKTMLNYDIGRICDSFQPQGERSLINLPGFCVRSCAPLLNAQRPIELSKGM